VGISVAPDPVTFAIDVPDRGSLTRELARADDCEGVARPEDRLELLGAAGTRDHSGVDQPAELTISGWVGHDHGSATWIRRFE
jgi:hypothetical protein